MSQPQQQRNNKWAHEFVVSARKSPRLTGWEREFVASIAAQLDRAGRACFFSTKQWETMERIDNKVHAAG